MNDNCVHFQEILEIQRSIILKHIGPHKWFQHIEDDEEAKADFVEKFGWVMREVYCGYACVDRFDCVLAQKYLPKPRDDQSKS